jgi:DNA-binding response OmpR family regulator
MKILVADDETQIVEILKVFLEKKGYVIDTASSGKAALGMIEKNGYGLAILDENMPELTGLEVAKIVKERGLPTKIVLLTGYSNINKEFATVVGADEYLHKPVDLNEMDTVIKKIVSSP